MTDRAHLRRRIAELDDEILALAAERCRLGQEVGKIKHKAGEPSIDYVQERRVLERTREAARGQGLDENLAEDLIARLIIGSVAVQEQDRLKLAGSGHGKQAVILGGAGRMGGWVERFLVGHGYSVAIVDPVLDDQANAAGRAALHTADLVICAMAPGAIATTYQAWTAGPPEERPKGIVADIASIKTPLIEAIGALRAAGCQVGSFHPMFGPDLVTLRGADVVICPTGDDDAMQALEGLFQPTTAKIWRLDLEDHDQVMADVLALAHASAIAFAAALGEGPPVHSTTLGGLEKIASGVVGESPEVYYEIQASNPHAAPAIERLRGQLEALQRAVGEGDHDAFEHIMTAGRLALADRRRRRAAAEAVADAPESGETPQATAAAPDA